MNPRIVKGRRGTGVAIAARGVAGDERFQIAARSDLISRLDRMQLEDRLLAEATALIERVQAREGFDWAAHRFQRHEELDLWEKVLTANELARLMGG